MMRSNGSGRWSARWGATVVVTMVLLAGCGGDELAFISEPDECGDGVEKTDLAGGPGGEECDDGNRRDGDGCSAECLLEPRLVDVSDFETFEFRRESAFGFCPPVGAIFRGRVAADGAGTATFEGLILRGDARCQGVAIPDAECLDLEEFTRPLGVEEEAELREALRAVAVHEQRPNGCDTIAFDPCLVNAFQWDTFRVTDFECRAPKLPDAEVRRLLRLLEELVRDAG